VQNTVHHSPDATSSAPARMTDDIEFPTLEEAHEIHAADTRNTKRDRAVGSTTPRSVPVPPPVPVTGGEVPELRQLEEHHRAGRLHPVPVRLGRMPDDATPLMRAIADHMATRMGLRLAVDDDWPLPYATTEAIRAGFATNAAQVSRAIARLVRAGVIRHVGSLPRRRGGPPEGTKLYAPGAPEDVLPPLARAIEADRTGAVDQRQEVREHPAVLAAVADDRREVTEGDSGMGATGDDAVAGHDHDVRSGDGRLALDVYGSEDALVAAFIEGFDATELTGRAA